MNLIMLIRVLAHRVQARACISSAVKHSRCVTTTAVQQAFIASSPLRNRLAAMEIADPDKARLIKRVLRKPGALRRMKVDQAVEVGLAMLETKNGAMIRAIQAALEVDSRRRVQNALGDAYSAPVRYESSKDVVALTTELISGPDAVDKIWQCWHSQTLDTDTLTNWMLEDPAHAIAGARLTAPDHVRVILETLYGRFNVDLSEYVTKLAGDNRKASIAEVAKSYRGPLTADVVVVAADERDPFEAWPGINEVSDEMLSACLAPQGAMQRLNDTAVFSFVEHGVVDAWRFTQLPMTTPQRRALCMAAGRAGAWDVVNTVLSQWVVYGGTSGFSGGDLSLLLQLPGHVALTSRARLECLRFCSSVQLLQYASSTSRADADMVVALLESDGPCYADARQVFNLDPRSGRGDGRYFMRQLIRGKHAGKALQMCSPTVAQIVVDELRGLIGDDAAVWRTALSLAADWAGTLDELATAAKTLAK